MISLKTITNYWKKTNILSQEINLLTSIPIPNNKNKMQELKRLVTHLLENNYLSVDDYIYINDNIKDVLTNKEILKMITNEKDKCNEKDKFVNEIIREIKKITLTEAKMYIDKMIRFLYE
ncbi:3788_t:CDS:2 [Funneliformis caledonium]|uniref:3788_t:CDS:1 n=1 Tax=Funneliformis caledonium TaxID=1117310 RepID=A0A9N9BVX5_9GLOM|nr:3788_t:CDS:2 [Funneliformis caledonium]